MGIAERLALAQSGSDLSWSELKIKPIDFVAALSASSSLGSDIFRSRDSDEFALRRAILSLTKKAIVAGRESRIPLSRDMAHSISIAVLSELLLPKCRECRGASVVIAGDIKVQCPACDGVGVHRYSDKERADLIGISFNDWGKFSKRYQMVLSIARSHDCAVSMSSNRLG